MSWNCNGRFRGKKELVQSFNADICIIQESENPQKYPHGFFDIFGNYHWIGLNDNKGLLVFSDHGVLLDIKEWNNYGLRHFLPLRVNNSFDLVAVWAGFPYIEEYYIYQQIYKSFYNSDTIIVGDFNSNSIWDKKHKERNHSEVVRQLNSIGLMSAYHISFGEDQGKETQNTFYLHRDINKGYHIDYCFINSERLNSFEIEDKNTWLEYSDHLPIIIDIKY